jgi:DNA-binding response OmpR family regulator
VIENDESLIEIVSYEFAEHGWKVYTALDGDKGVALALEHKPSAIICDIIMGEMHGFDVLRKLREHREMKNTVIIITSAKAYKPDIDRAHDLGATDYVVKPFRTDELRELVERRLAIPRELEP